MIPTKNEQYILDSITIAVQDALEDLGLDQTSVKSLWNPARLQFVDRSVNAMTKGVDNYIRKIEINGGVPKPACV